MFVMKIKLSLCAALCVLASCQDKASEQGEVAPKGQESESIVTMVPTTDGQVVREIDSDLLQPLVAYTGDIEDDEEEASQDDVDPATVVSPGAGVGIPLAVPTPEIVADKNGETLVEKLPLKGLLQGAIVILPDGKYRGMSFDMMEAMFVYKDGKLAEASAKWSDKKSAVYTATGNNETMLLLVDGIRKKYTAKNGQLVDMEGLTVDQRKQLHDVVTSLRMAAGVFTTDQGRYLQK